MKFLLTLLISFSIIFSQGLSVQILNDAIYETDEELSGGFQLLYQDNKHWSFYLGQKIYTPTNKDIRQPLQGERPYNAWLYTGVIYQQEYEGIEILYTLQGDVGVVGPSAMGEEMQNGLHTLIGVDNALGWESQTEDSIESTLTFSAEYPLIDFFKNGKVRNLHLSTYVYTQAGTLLENYSTGLSMAIGYHVPYYASLINFPSKNAFYLFANLQVTAVEKNRLLDGNSGYNVVSEDYIERYDLGFNWDISNFRVRFTATKMSKEYTTQVVGHNFVRVEFTLGF